MNITIREMTAADAAVWADMRQALWPFTTAEENRRDIDNILAGEGMTGFIALDATGVSAGFAEVARAVGPITSDVEYSAPSHALLSTYASPPARLTCVARGPPPTNTDSLCRVARTKSTM